MLRRLLLIALVAGAAVAAEALDDALLAAARKGDAVAVRDLLAKGAAVNAATAYGVTPLLYAAGKGHLEVVQELLKGGAEVNVEDSFYHESPLSNAAYRGHVNVVGLLLEKGATNRGQALVSGVYGNQPEAVKLLLTSNLVDRATLTNALRVAKEKHIAPIVEAIESALQHSKGSSAEPSPSKLPAPDPNPKRDARPSR